MKSREGEKPKAKQELRPRPQKSRLRKRKHENAETNTSSQHSQSNKRAVEGIPNEIVKVTTRASGLSPTPNPHIPVMLVTVNHRNEEPSGVLNAPQNTSTLPNYVPQICANHLERWRKKQMPFH